MNRVATWDEQQLAQLTRWIVTLIDGCQMLHLLKMHIRIEHGRQTADAVV